MPQSVVIVKSPPSTNTQWSNVGGNNLWSNALNFTPNGVPDAFTNVQADGISNANINLTSIAGCRSFDIGNYSGVISGGTLTVQRDLTADPGNTATVGSTAFTVYGNATFESTTLSIVNLTVVGNFSVANGTINNIGATVTGSATALNESITNATFIGNPLIATDCPNGGGNTNVTFIETADPVILTAPVIAGTGEVGSTLTATPGTASGINVVYTGQWTLDTGSGPVPITGETGLTYDPVIGDLAGTIKYYDIWTNSHGAVTDASNGILVIPVPPAVETWDTAYGTGFTYADADERAISPPSTSSNTRSLVGKITGTWGITIRKNAVDDEHVIGIQPSLQTAFASYPGNGGGPNTGMSVYQAVIFKADAGTGVNLAPLIANTQQDVYLEVNASIGTFYAEVGGVPCMAAPIAISNWVAGWDLHAGVGVGNNVNQEFTFLSDWVGVTTWKTTAIPADHVLSDRYLTDTITGNNGDWLATSFAPTTGKYIVQLLHSTLPATPRLYVGARKASGQYACLQIENGNNRVYLTGVGQGVTVADFVSGNYSYHIIDYDNGTYEAFDDAGASINGPYALPTWVALEAWSMSIMSDNGTVSVTQANYGATALTAIGQALALAHGASPYPAT